MRFFIAVLMGMAIATGALCAGEPKQSAPTQADVSYGPHAMNGTTR